MYLSIYLSIYLSVLWTQTNCSEANRQATSKKVSPSAFQANSYSACRPPHPSASPGATGGNSNCLMVMTSFNSFLAVGSYWYRCVQTQKLPSFWLGQWWMGCNEHTDSGTSNVIRHWLIGFPMLVWWVNTFDTTFERRNIHVHMSIAVLSKFTSSLGVRTSRIRNWQSFWRLLTPYTSIYQSYPPKMNQLPKKWPNSIDLTESLHQGMW